MKPVQLFQSQKRNLKNPQFIYFIFWAAVSLWCLLIVAAPLLSAMGKKLLSGLIYLFFSPACHQLPERSFHILGKPFAVCSRCSGIYFGFWLISTCYPFFASQRKATAPEPKWLLFALIPISTDFAIQIFHILNNTFYSRTITGFVLGVVVAFFIVPAIVQIGFEQKDRKILQKIEEKNHASKT